MATLTPTGGRRRRQLRAAVRAGRAGRPAVHGHDGDRELLALVEEPYTDVEETERRLRTLLDAFEERHDRRAVFLGIYARMTAAVADRSRAGVFADPAWVDEYLVAFANLYRRAVYDYEDDALESVADPWQVAFDAALAGDALVVQDAALGVNAHINYDLALAVDAVGTSPDPATKYSDHSIVTDVIGVVLDDARASLGEWGADGFLSLSESLGRLDEWLTVLTIDECRDSAWRTARALESSVPLRRRFARWVNDVTSTGAAYLILSTTASDRVHETLVELEGEAKP